MRTFNTTEVSNNNNNYRKQRKTLNDPCFHCGEIGHWGKDCPEYNKFKEKIAEKNKKKNVRITENNHFLGEVVEIFSEDEYEYAYAAETSSKKSSGRPRKKPYASPPKRNNNRPPTPESLTESDLEDSVA